jgi:F420-dependent oxidoreductase-like protein
MDRTDLQVAVAVFSVVSPAFGRTAAAVVAAAFIAGRLVRERRRQRRLARTARDEHRRGSRGRGLPSLPSARRDHDERSRVRICLMIEGQEGVEWADWVALARACERLGFDALFRSDHYLSVGGRAERGSLDAWGTVSALAAITTKLRLGTLVSPATFRHPSVLAKAAVTADHISSGRVELGVGTGWLEEEHTAYGFPFPPMDERMARLAEQLEVITRAWSDGPQSFEGEHYTIRDLDARPKPVQQPRLPLIVGGAAGPRSAALAARYADEYNTVFVTPEQAAERRRTLDKACEDQGRDPHTLRFSMMNGFVIGNNRQDIEARRAELAEWGAAPGEAWIVGTPDEFVARLREYEEAGIEAVMLQHHLFHDEGALELIAREVIPALTA